MKDENENQVSSIHTCPTIHLTSKAGMSFLTIAKAWVLCPYFTSPWLHVEGRTWKKFGSLWELCYSEWHQRSGALDNSGSRERFSVLQLLAPSGWLNPAAFPKLSSNAPRTLFQLQLLSVIKAVGFIWRGLEEKAGLSVYQSQFAV